MGKRARERERERERDTVLCHMLGVGTCCSIRERERGGERVEVGRKKEVEED
jgi:hypothetical protein